MPTRTVLRYVPPSLHPSCHIIHACPQIEEQRRYLGGDSEHTVLVKGLDFALLEQNRARATAATEDDDALEQVFQEASSSLPKKRTREEIVNELKSKRLKGPGTPEGDVLKVVDAPLEEAKKAGKFKPIGFKPIGSADGAKKKKKVKVKAKAKEDAAGVKKKVTTKPVAKSGEGKAPATPEPATAASTSKNVPTAQPVPEPEPLDGEFDIFAGAGEYTGVDLGDDDESEGEISETEGKRARTSATPDADAPPSRHWFETEEEKAQRTSASPPRSKSSPPEMIPEEREEGEEEEEEAPARLAALASSSIPSIRDFLAMDAEAEKAEKRRAKKEKKKKGLP